MPPATATCWSREPCPNCCDYPCRPLSVHWKWMLTGTLCSYEMDRWPIYWPHWFLSCYEKKLEKYAKTRNFLKNWLHFLVRHTATSSHVDWFKALKQSCRRQRIVRRFNQRTHHPGPDCRLIHSPLPSKLQKSCRFRRPTGIKNNPFWHRAQINLVILKDLQ